LKALQQKKEDRDEGNDQMQDAKSKRTQADLDQMKALLMPVTDEDKRVAHLIQNGKLKDPTDIDVNALNLRPQTTQTRAIKLEKQMFDAHDEEDNKFRELMAQIERDRIAKVAQRELECKAILKKIDDATDPDEKRRFVEQFEKLQKE
jgi:hypothetical protein